MPKITKVYTRTGDDGTTGLGTGARVRKDSPRIAAIGDVDELNAALGVVLASAGLDAALRGPLEAVQNELFHLGADLCIPEEDKAASPAPRIEERHAESLERLMDRLSEGLPALENFILPGGSPAAAQLHAARAVCRRAERTALSLSREEKVSPAALKYLNRLSDALFVMARFQNCANGGREIYWNSRA